MNALGAFLHHGVASRPLKKLDPLSRVCCVGCAQEPRSFDHSLGFAVVMTKGSMTFKGSMGVHNGDMSGYGGKNCLGGMGGTGGMGVRNGDMSGYSGKNGLGGMGGMGGHGHMSYGGHGGGMYEGMGGMGGHLGVSEHQLTAGARREEWRRKAHAPLQEKRFKRPGVAQGNESEGSALELVDQARGSDFSIVSAVFESEGGSTGGGGEGEGGGGKGGGGEGGGTEVQATEATDHAGANNHNLVLIEVNEESRAIRMAMDNELSLDEWLQESEPHLKASTAVALPHPQPMLHSVGLRPPTASLQPSHKPRDLFGGRAQDFDPGGHVSCDRAGGTEFGSVSGAVLKREAVISATFVTTSTSGGNTLIATSATTCSGTSAAVIAANSVSTSMSIAVVAELRAHGARASSSVTVLGSAVSGSGVESKCLNLRGGGCGASKDNKVHSYNSNAEQPEAIARVGDTVALQETGAAAPATANVSALTTEAFPPVQESAIIKLSGAADKLDGSSKKAMQTFLHLPSHQMASSINIKQCDAVRLTAHIAVSTRCSQSTFETSIVSVVEALGPLVGKPEFEGDTNTLLEILRFLVLGVGAGTRAKGVDLLQQCALVAALKKPAGRAALVQVRGGSSPAEQVMHIVMAEAAVRTLPRLRGYQFKAAKAALRLTVSIAKSAATMSLDPNLLTSLQDCVQLAGNANSPTHHSTLSL